MYIPGTTYLHIPLAHPWLYYYLLIPQYTVLHMLLFICSSYLNFVPIFIYMLLCCVTYFALSIEWTWPDLHFTTDYILYNWVCDEEKKPWTLNLVCNILIFISVFVLEILVHQVRLNLNEKWSQIAEIKFISANLLYYLKVNIMLFFMILVLVY